MKYAKLDEKNKVIQVQPNKEDGFIEVDDSVYVGMTKDTGNTFVAPPKSSIEIQKYIQMTLMILCDTKQDEAVKLVLGYKATPYQIERYKDKYERAKAGEWDSATNTEIITNYETYLGNVRAFVDLIEYFRSNVDDLIIAGNLDRANELIELAKGFDETTTLAELEGLFA